MKVAQDDMAGDAPLAGMRIARVSTIPFFVVSQLSHQIGTLAASGAHVTVITSAGPELESLRQRTGVDCVAVDIPRSISPWRDLLALVRLWSLFRRMRFDIVHSTTPKAGLLTALAGRLAGVPIRLHTFTGQPWVNMHGVKRWLARASDRLIGRLNTHCYADSMSQRLFLIEQGLVGADRLSVIGHGSLAGVDLARFDRARFSEEQRHALRQSLGIPPDAEVLLFVGRITADKGVRELLSAFARLKAAGSRAHLVLVGPFDPEGDAGGRILPGDVAAIRDAHVVGYSDSPEQYMAIADILCLPSYREGFGTVVIEAAAMGVPTIGTNIYGLSDAIVDGQTGILAAPQDADSLHAGLMALLSDSGRRAEMGQSARQRAHELFAADRVSAGLIEEYLRLGRACS